MIQISSFISKKQIFVYAFTLQDTKSFTHRNHRFIIKEEFLQENLVMRNFFHSFKNRISSYLKNFEVRTLIWILPRICSFVKQLLLFTFYRKTKVISCYSKGNALNLANLSRTLGKRNIVQKDKKSKRFNFLSKVSKSPRLSYYLYLFKGLKYYKD